MKINYEQRARRILIVSLGLLAIVSSLTILRPALFTLGCTTMTTLCTAVTFRAWYIIYHHSKEDI
jgi:uncharacterized membrane protein YccC